MRIGSFDVNKYCVCSYFIIVLDCRDIEGVSSTDEEFICGQCSEGMIGDGSTCTGEIEGRN